MSDFENLNPQQRAVLNIKLDGHVEAAVAAARHLNLGLEEALSRCLLATQREFRAYGIDYDKAREMWDQAAAQVYPPPSIVPRAIN